MRILVATTNLGKIKEFQDIFPSKIKILSLQDLNIDIDVVEYGETFRENALIKAKQYYSISKIPTISEDSGLVIDYLKGEPGIFSARYGGKNLSDDQRVDLVLRNMNGVESIQRSARFISVICGIGFFKEPLFSKGVMEGFISDTKNGINGFGYDPIFIPLGSKITFGQMPYLKKLKLDHRYIAFKKLKKRIKTL